MTTINVLSIDIGLKNLAFYKEEFDYYKLNNIELPKEIYNSDKSATKEFEQYLRKVYECGTSCYLEVFNLGDKKDYFSGICFLKLIDILEYLNKQKLFDDVDIILIELQLKKNNIAQTLMHHIHNWFLIMFRDFKQIILYPSKNKTRVLGAPLIKEINNKKEKINKYERKQWAVKMADEILTTRNEIDFHNKIFIEHKNKKDDLSDVIIQTLSYHIKMICKLK